MCVCFVCFGTFSPSLTFAAHLYFHFLSSDIDFGLKGLRAVRRGPDVEHGEREANFLRDILWSARMWRELPSDAGLASRSL